MDEAVVRDKVSQLMSAMRPLPLAVPPDQKDAVAEPPGSAMKRDMAALEDNLDHIRLAVKYLVFDLEATKRENRVLRQMMGGD